MTFFETAVELLHLLTDEADGEDRDLLDDGISVVNVLRYLLDDPRPSIPGEFDAANCCNDIGSCSPDEFFLVYHGVEDQVFESWPASGRQRLPQVFTVVFNLDGDKEKGAC